MGLRRGRCCKAFRRTERGHEPVRAVPPRARRETSDDSLDGLHPVVYIWSTGRSRPAGGSIQHAMRSHHGKTYYPPASAHHGPDRRRWRGGHPGPFPLCARRRGGPHGHRRFGRTGRASVGRGQDDRRRDRVADDPRRDVRRAQLRREWQRFHRQHLRVQAGDRRVQRRRRRACHRPVGHLCDGRDPSQEQRGPPSQQRCRAEVQRRREQVPHGADPLRGHRVREPIADDLCARPARHLGHRQLHATLCRSVTVDGVSTDPSTAHSNTDGCDPECCDHVVIKNCDLGAHDDNIAIKSGRDADGRRVNVPCQNIVVFGCRMNGNWGAITCGSELTGGIRNVYAYKCTLVGVTKFALYVKSNTKRGGFAENINLDSFSGVLDRSVAFVTSTYNSQTGSFVPWFGPLAITNSSCTHAGRKAFDVSGLSNSHIRGFVVRDGNFSDVIDTSNVLNFVDDLSFTNVWINGARIPDVNPMLANRYEAERATISQGAVETAHAGYSGTGFVNYANLTGSYVQWTVNAAAAGTATLALRYGNGTTTDRPMDISVNGTVVASGVSFPSTGVWTNWTVKRITAALNAGTNTVRATATTVNGGPNVDFLEIAS